MKAKLRGPYSLAFKKKTVSRTYRDEYTIADVANELGINKGSLKRWREEFEQSGESLECDHEEMSLEEQQIWLKTELAIVKEEVRILKALHKIHGLYGG